MSHMPSPGPGATLKALWRRAPVWRLLAMSASLLTLLFVLFTPESARDVKPSTLAALEKASYTPRPHAPARVDPADATPNGASLGTPAKVVAVATTQSAPVRNAATAAVDATPVALPKTATLSMVTASPATKDNESGLDPALMGHAYRGSARIDGFDIPLPAGDWITLANSTVTRATFSGDVYFLGQVRKKRLIGAMRIFAMRSKNVPGDGFDEVKSCTEVNPYRINVVIDEPLAPHGHQACWSMRNYYATPWSQWADRAAGLPSVDRAAAGDMAAKGVTYPQDFVNVTFTRTETWGLLEIDHLYSPEAAGFTSTTVMGVKDSDWTAQNLAHEPDKAAYIDKLKGWGSAWWPRFKTAFEQAAPVAAPAGGASSQTAGADALRPARSASASNP